MNEWQYLETTIAALSFPQIMDFIWVFNHIAQISKIIMLFGNYIFPFLLILVSMFVVAGYICTGTC